MTRFPNTRPSPYRRSAQSALRTLRLVMLSLAAVGIAFAVYEMVQDPAAEKEVEVAGIPAVHQEFLDVGLDEAESGLQIGELPLAKGGSSEVMILDDALRNKMHLAFEDRRPLDDQGKLWALDRPTLTFFMPRGEKATLRADHAELTVRTAGRLEPRRGRLWGNVRIVLDRTTNRWREANPELAHKPTPQTQLVRVWLDALEFDRERGRLTSSGDVRIESVEMRLLGRGLEVRWSDASNRLEYLKIAEGQELTFESDSDIDLQMAEQIATGRGREAPPDAQEAAAAKADDAPAVQADGAANLPADVLIVDVEPDRFERPEINTYEIEFTRAVVARQETGEGRLLADYLTVLMDLASGGSNTATPAAAPPAADGADGAMGPAALADGTADAETAAPADAETAAPDSGDAVVKSRVHVSWQGPLVIRAADQQQPDEGPVVLRRRMTAVGSPVVVESSDGSARAAQLVRDVNTGFTQLIGSEQHGITMDGGDNMQLAAQRLIELDMAARTVHMEGQVEVVMDDSRLAAERIEAHFAAPGPERRGTSLRDLIERLDCHQQVRLRQQDGDMQCEQLVVELGPDANGRNIPRKADASQRVSLVRGSRALRADIVHVLFGDLSLDEQGRPLSLWPKTRAVEAKSQVSVVDPERQWDIEGRELKLTFDDQEVITYGYVEGREGRDARVQLGSYAIEGASVTFDEAKQWAHVPGAGRGRFLMEQDLDGRQLDGAVPVAVQWRDHMTLDGPNDLLTFKGAVQATSEHNTLTGEILEITLEEDRPEQVATAPPSDPLGLWVLRPYQPEAESLGRLFGRGAKQEQPSRLRLTKRAREILARGQPAVLQSIDEDPLSGALRSKMALRSTHIRFNIDQQIMLVDRAGLLSIEDYPDVTQMAQAHAGIGGGGLFGNMREDGPSQTVIQWDSSMRYYYAQRAAEIDSRDSPVDLVHLSGSHIRVNEQLLQRTGLEPDRLAQLRSMGTGREARLSCGRLLVQFDAADSSAGAGQMSFGQLRQFEAEDDVVLFETRDGWYISGNRVVFVKEGQVVEVHGTRDTMGFISRVDPNSRRRLEARCPSLFLELETGRVDAPECPSISIGQ